MRSRAAGTSGTGRNSQLKPNRQWSDPAARALSLSSQTGQGQPPERHKEQDYELVFPAVTRPLRRTLTGHVWHTVAGYGFTKSPLGHQPPGTALWMALKLALDGDAASDVWLL